MNTCISIHDRLSHAYLFSYRLEPRPDAVNERSYSSNQSVSRWQEDKSTEHYETMGRDDRISIEMIDLQTRDKTNSKSSKQLTENCTFKKNSQVDDVVLTDSEPITSPSSLCNDVTAIKNASLDKEEENSLKDDNNPCKEKKYNCREDDGEAVITSNTLSLCDNIPSNTTTTVAGIETRKQLTPTLTSNTVSPSSISTHSTNSVSLPAVVSTSIGKKYDLFEK